MLGRKCAGVFNDLVDIRLYHVCCSFYGTDRDIAGDYVLSDPASIPRIK
jgi:hypothetical protein